VEDLGDVQVNRHLVRAAQGGEGHGRRRDAHGRDWPSGGGGGGGSGSGTPQQFAPGFLFAEVGSLPVRLLVRARIGPHCLAIKLSLLRLARRFLAVRASSPIWGENSPLTSCPKMKGAVSATAAGAISAAATVAVTVVAVMMMGECCTLWSSVM